MNLVNLTPHALTIASDGQEQVVIPPSGTVARVNANQAVVTTINNVDVVKSTFSNIMGLPDPQPDTVYIVSSLVAQAVTAQSPRLDVVAPDTGPTAIRDEAGKIVAVRRFQKF